MVTNTSGCHKIYVKIFRAHNEHFQNDLLFRYGWNILSYHNIKYTDSESGLSADFKNRRIPGTKNAWKILLY